jgi:membrane protein DedA with SNARE-associated domain
MTDSAVHLNQFLDMVFQYGPFWVYAVIFAACFIENIFPPFPGDTFIVAAGGMVGVSRLDLITSMIVIISGGMCSVMLLYTVGRRYGRDYFIRKDFKYFSAADVIKMEVRLQKWGALILILSRFIAGARSAIALASGIGQYSKSKMLVFSSISYLIFTSLLMYASIKLVKNLDEIGYYFKLYNKIIWPILIGLLVIYIVYKYRNSQKKA